METVNRVRDCELEEDLKRPHSLGQPIKWKLELIGADRLYITLAPLAGATN